LKEAIKRAEAYTKAGADAIFMHSAKSDFSEIESFVKEWAQRTPIVIVPTKYYKTPTDVFRKNKINTVMWANHNMRAAVKAMQETSAFLYKNQTLVGVEDKIATVNEIFRLQNEKELGEADKKYL